MERKKIISEFNKYGSPWELVLRAFKQLRITKKNLLCFLIILGICFILASGLDKDEFIYISELSNNIFMVFLGVVFTAFIFFHTLLSKESIEVWFIRRSQDSKTRLQELHEHFIGACVIYAVNIILNYIVILILRHGFIYDLYNSIKYISVVVYLVYILWSMFEIINLLHSVFMIFTVNIQIQICYLNEERKSEKSK